MQQNLNIVHIWDGWFNSNYPAIKPIQRDEKLQIGGWGDYYTSPLRFDLTGLPVAVTDASLFLWALPSGAANPSQVSMFPITSPWDVMTGQTFPKIGWDNFPQTSPGSAWVVSTTVNTWRGYGITTWYNEWKGITRPDRGVLIWPYNNDGSQRFDKFASSRVTASNIGSNLSTRPILALTFTPTLQVKMPLSGGYSWLATNEVGGYECTGQLPWPDTAHQGGNYFSIDFNATNIKDNGGSYTGSIPVLAVASGTVQEVGFLSSTGYYITLNHGNGYYTRYLHFDTNAARKNGVLLAQGNAVTQGDQIGIMGNGGFSTGPHVHINFWYGGYDPNSSYGASTNTNLAYVLMDGLLLKSYQTECNVGSTGKPTGWKRYYHSSNTPTGK